MPGNASQKVTHLKLLYIKSMSSYFGGKYILRIYINMPIYNCITYITLSLIIFLFQVIYSSSVVLEYNFGPIVTSGDK